MSKYLILHLLELMVHHPAPWHFVTTEFSTRIYDATNNIVFDLSGVPKNHAIMGEFIVITINRMVEAMMDEAKNEVIH